MELYEAKELIIRDRIKNKIDKEQVEYLIKDNKNNTSKKIDGMDVLKELLRIRESNEKRTEDYINLGDGFNHWNCKSCGNHLKTKQSIKRNPKCKCGRRRLILLSHDKNYLKDIEIKIFNNIIYMWGLEGYNAEEFVKRVYISKGYKVLIKKEYSVLDHNESKLVFNLKFNERLKLKKGYPDFYIYNNFERFFVEVKNLKDTIRPDQLFIHHMLNLNNVKSYFFFVKT